MLFFPPASYTHSSSPLHPPPPPPPPPNSFIFQPLYCPFQSSFNSSSSNCSSFYLFHSSYFMLPPLVHSILSHIPHIPSHKNCFSNHRSLSPVTLPLSLVLPLFHESPPFLPSPHPTPALLFLCGYHPHPTKVPILNHNKAYVLPT